MAGLNLTPNETVGYRLKPDYYNWTVVALKRHGQTSKHAGDTYETPVGYYRTLPMALSALFNLEARLHGEEAQQAARLSTGVSCSHEALLEAFTKAETSVLKMAEAFEKELAEAGVNLDALTKRFRPHDTSMSDDV